MVHSPSSPDSDSEMAAVAVQAQPSMGQGPHSVANAGANKRYRPAPAKTFQCRGYGECRMVFSRSEHLARHIRKHTGERPFSCHCSKQFSRLDNLRQHAQTVHADKQDENERMMRDLTSLHATMSAANKLSSSTRGGRRMPTAGGANTASSAAASGIPLTLVKQEDPPPLHQRPGTSTGYEGGDMLYYDNSTSSRSASNSSFRAQSHSFREPGQSFLVPPATTSSSNASTAAAAAAPGQSFLGYQRVQHPIAESSRFDSSFRPGTSSSRPTTSSGITDSQLPRLPPLSAVVAATLSTSPEQSFRPLSSAGPNVAGSQQSQQRSAQSILPLPSSFPGRPSTAYRPGTAPATASLFSAKSSVYDRSRMGSSSGRPNLSLLHSGFGGSSSSGVGNQHHQHHQLGDSGELTHSPGNESSPFFFNAPPAPTSAPAPPTASPPSINPRKRTFAGPDGPCDDTTPLRSDRPTSSAGPIDYDYGSESRPQSRRLSVMELCNDDDEPSRPASQRRDVSQYSSGSATFLLSSAATRAYGPSSRPTTSSGLVSSTSTLRLFDRSSPGSSPSSATVQPPPLFPRTSSSAAGSAGDRTSSGPGGSGAASAFGRTGGGLHAAERVPSNESSAQIPSAGSSPSTDSPSTPTYPSASLLSASNSSSSAYPDRGPLQYQQQPQQLEQQHGQPYQPAQQQQHASQYQLTHSPTFSPASSLSNASYSPRSPVSDGSRGSPFAAYAKPRSPGLYGGDAGHSSPSYAGGGVSAGSHHRQRDSQIRTSVSPHTASFGMRA